MPRLEPVFKSSKTDVDPVRALRMIRILGALSLILAAGTIASWWWASRAAGALRINLETTSEGQQAKVFMEARMSSAGKEIRSGDTVSDPTVTIHGILADFGRLREGLDGLAVTVRGTRVDIFPETGEFTEKVILTPGLNRIEFGVWWNGREWQRQHLNVIYEKPLIDPF